MRNIILLSAFVLVLPLSLAAQNIGFAVGIQNPPVATPGQGSVGYPGPGIGAGTGYIIEQERYGRQAGYGHLYPTGTVIVSPDPYGVLRGGSLRAPRSAGSTVTVIGPGGVWVVSPNRSPGRRLAPHHPTAAPSHPVAAPLVIPSPVTGYPGLVPGQTRGVRVIRGGDSRVRSYTSAPPVFTGATVSGSSEVRAGIGIGSTRDDVLRAYGTPTRLLSDPVAETLIFGGTRVVIQNGVVVAVGHY